MAGDPQRAALRRFLRAQPGDWAQRLRRPGRLQGVRRAHARRALARHAGCGPGAERAPALHARRGGRRGPRRGLRVGESLRSPAAFDGRGRDAFPAGRGARGRAGVSAARRVPARSRWRPAARHRRRAGGRARGLAGPGPAGAARSRSGRAGAHRSGGVPRRRRGRARQRQWLRAGSAGLRGAFAAPRDRVAAARQPRDAPAPVPARAGTRRGAGRGRGRSRAAGRRGARPRPPRRRRGRGAGGRLSGRVPLPGRVGGALPVGTGLRLSVPKLSVPTPARGRDPDQPGYLVRPRPLDLRDATRRAGPGRGGGHAGRRGSGRARGAVPARRGTGARRGRPARGIGDGRGGRERRAGRQSADRLAGAASHARPQARRAVPRSGSPGAPAALVGKRLLFCLRSRCIGGWRSPRRSPGGRARSSRCLWPRPAGCWAASPGSV